MSSDDILNTIQDAEKALINAMLSGDTVMLDQLLHPDLVFIIPGGQVIGKADDLAAYASGTMKVNTLEIIDQNIQTLETCATVVTRVEMAGQFSGHPFNDRLIFLRNWYLSANGWQVISGSSSIIG